MGQSLSLFQKWSQMSQVLKDFHDQGNRCYIKYEKKQNCFHITVR